MRQRVRAELGQVLLGTTVVGDRSQKLERLLLLLLVRFSHARQAALAEGVAQA
jgi:hypothetical protein